MIEQNCSASKWKSNWKLEMYEMKTLLFQNVIPRNIIQLFQSSNKMWDMNTMYVSVKNSIRQNGKSLWLVTVVSKAHLRCSGILWTGTGTPQKYTRSIYLVLLSIDDSYWELWPSDSCNMIIYSMLWHAQLHFNGCSPMICGVTETCWKWNVQRIIIVWFCGVFL